MRHFGYALSCLVFLTLDLHAAVLSQLVDAVKNADTAAIRSMLRQHINVNASEADGTTALHWAVRVDDLQIVEALIRAGAHVTAANRYGVTPLHLACLNGNAAIVETLLKAGADPNTIAFEGETVLMTAARSGNANAVKALLSHGADVNAKEHWRGQTALMWAAAEDHPETVRTLIANGADMHARSNGGFTALLFAVREGKIGAVKALLEMGASLNESLPRRGGSVVAAESPIASENGPNAFLLAAANAHYELAAFLLDAGADPNAAPQGWTALHQVSWVRKPGVGYNNPAPQGSGNMESLEFVKKLVASGANVNARVTKKPNMGTTNLNSIGATPFLLAARTHDSELMRLLVDLGADPLLSNEDGTTPLLVAAGVGTESPVEDAGTEPEVLESVKLVLELGGDINAVDNNGDTVMHGAAYKHAPSVVHFLAEKGAKSEIWNQSNKKGLTPLKIVEGIRVGVNILSDASTVTAILEELGGSPNNQSR